MSANCLALNASYEPLTTINLARAMRLVLAGKAEVVEADPQRRVRTRNAEHPWPVVIRLVKYVAVPRKLRRRVTNTFLFARDGYRCAYCGRHESELKEREGLTRDHLVPQSRGGGNSWENCVTACSTCNHRKADCAPAEVGLKLRVVPTEPSFVELKWNLRRLTPIQRKYVTMFYGADVVRALE